MTFKHSVKGRSGETARCVIGGTLQLLLRCKDMFVCMRFVLLFCWCFSAGEMKGESRVLWEASFGRQVRRPGV